MNKIYISKFYSTFFHIFFMVTQNDIDAKQVGLRIRQIRENTGKTQSEFAEEFGITQTALSKLEQGKHLPTTSQVDNMIKNHNVTYKWLMEGIDETASNVAQDANADYLPLKPDCKVLEERCHNQEAMIVRLEKQVAYLEKANEMLMRHQEQLGKIIDNQQSK